MNLLIPQRKRADGSPELAKKLAAHPEIFLRRLRKLGPADVYLVNGFLLRNHVFIDFTEGGNSAAYAWLRQKPAMFILDVANILEAKPILLHEIREYNGMILDGMDYEAAHEYANQHEQLARNYPELADSMLEEEIARFMTTVGH